MHHGLPCGRRLAALAFCLLLAGCFSSAQPKFPLSTAAPAFGEGGRYAMYERKDGKFERSDAIDVRRRPDGAYDFVSADGETTPVSLHRIGPDRYVAQATDRSMKQTDYAVLDVRAKEVIGYAPACDTQDAAKLKAFGVEIGRHRCVIDGVADPAALFRALELGEPTSKLVRE